MEVKKNPKSNLQNYSKVFMLIGLVLALFVTYIAIENKTYDKQYGELDGVTMAKDIEDETIVMNNTPPPPPPPTPKTPPPPAPTEVEKVEDEEKIEEAVFEDTETDVDEAVEVDDIEEAEEAEEVVEDVAFSVIEEVPVFPGCKGTKEQKKKCLNKMMRKHVNRYFDTDLANQLGLPSGKKRIYLMFKIDKDGTITDIAAKAPHPRLKKEAIRIAKKLPRMKPGKQRGKPVRVKYTLPIKFIVE